MVARDYDQPSLPSWNGHVNNANYIRIAMEYLPEEFAYRHVRVEYKRPVRFGELIVPKTYLSTDGIFYVELLADNAVSAILELK